MQIVRQLSELAPAIERLREHGQRLALVPTMGALHAGHLALVEEARQRAGSVMATIFVNPLQFNDPTDLQRYPRSEEVDIEQLAQAGCNMLWLPAVDDIYPTGFATCVSVKGVSERWEGEHRPGHFDGVATVVAKLFIATRPDVAIFGEKDFQQLAVVRRMASDLGLGVEVVGLPTVRDPDGLALSSRNALLSGQEREWAPAFHEVLAKAADEVSGGAPVDTVLDRARAALAAAGFGPIDYLAYVDQATLEPLDACRDRGRLIAAAFLGQVRLIDNVCVRSATDRG